MLINMEDIQASLKQINALKHLKKTYFSSIAFKELKFYLKFIRFWPKIGFFLTNINIVNFLLRTILRSFNVHFRSVTQIEHF